MSSMAKTIVRRLEEFREKPAMCWNCNHPQHSVPCQSDRYTDVDGIEIDGPCGCKEVTEVESEQ